MHIFHRER